MKELESKISQDILDFFNTTDRMQFQDKVEILTLLIKKYAVMSKADFSLNRKDLQEIIAKAKQNFTELPNSVLMEGSDIPVHQVDLPHLCTVEATISLLNKNGCFKKLPKFNYKK